MHNRLNTTRSILLVFGLLASGSGCHVLNIPSYRADAPGGMCGANVASYNYAGCEMGDPESASSPTGYMTDGDCPPGFFPPLGCCAHGGLPVPACFAAWKAKRDLPEPAPYPRFHPLPTHPMFQSPPTLGVGQRGASTIASPQYGQLPSEMPGRQLPH